MIILPLIFSCIVYWMVGFNTTSPIHFAIYYVAYDLLPSSSVGCAFSGADPNRPCKPLGPPRRIGWCCAR